jgi:hypothetical protein
MVNLKPKPLTTYIFLMLDLKQILGYDGEKIEQTDNEIDQMV